MNISKRTLILFFCGLALIAGAYLSFKSDKKEPEEVEEVEEVEEAEEVEEVKTDKPETNETIQHGTEDGTKAAE